MIKMFFERKESAKLLTLLFLPALIGMGWIIHLFWMIGLAGWWSVIIALICLIVATYFLLKERNFTRQDFRWIIAPISVIILAHYLPWWDLIRTGHSDAAYHLIEANSFIGLTEWVPIHRDFLAPDISIDFLFRPPIVPALFSIEILISGDRSEIFVLPLLLLIGTCWQIQHLVERWGSKIKAALAIPVYLTLPVIRFWGQLDYLDVVAAGMWILTLHVLLINESDSTNRKITTIMGAFAAITFLCKHVNLYMIGLVGWFIIKDRSIERVTPFIQGWLIIAGPYLIYHFITQGNAFAAMSVHSSFAISSATNDVGNYNLYYWWAELESQLTVLGVLGCIVGMTLLWVRKRSDLIATCVLLVPLLILHGFILDWGEIRYHIPWLTLSIPLILVTPHYFDELNVNKEKERRNQVSCIGVIIIILLGTFHIGSIPDEIERANNEIEQNRNFLAFQISALDNIYPDSVLIAGHEQHLGLITNIPSYRFEYTDFPIKDAIDNYNATHVLTTNVAPRSQYEKNFDWQLGHGSIELDAVSTTNGWWVAALWRVDNTTYLNPLIYLENHTGNITGDLLILGPNETLIVGDDGLIIKWIKVSTIRPFQQVMEVLSGDIEPMIDGCLPENSECIIQSGGVISTEENSYIYAWIVSTF